MCPFKMQAVRFACRCGKCGASASHVLLDLDSMCWLWERKQKSGPNGFDLVVEECWK
jgi:hypothetical protein